MALRDVTVEINIKQASGLLGFGKPIILGFMTGGKPYKEYATLEQVKADYDGSVDRADAQIKAIYNMAKTIFEQPHRPKVIAIACNEHEKTNELGTEKGIESLLEKVYDKDFYFVLSTTDDIEVKKAIASVVEREGRKIFVTRGKQDLDYSGFAPGKYKRSVMCYHKKADEYMDAALVGECGSQPVGSITWKFRNLVGITPEDLTVTELNNLHAQGAIAYVKKAGVAQTSEGIVVDGEYIDIIHSQDFIQFNIEDQVQKLFTNSPKIPYTNNGIAMIESKVVNVLQEAYNNGIIAEGEDGPLYSTNFPKRNEVSQASRTGREYNAGTFEFELAGAVHTAKIFGTLKV